VICVSDDTFGLRHGQVVVSPGIPRDGDWKIAVGTVVTLRLADGSGFRTFVRGIEMASPPHRGGLALLLGPDLSPSDVPPGTKVWLDAADGAGS